MITVKDLLVNPSGKESGHVSPRYRIIEDLNNRFLVLYKEQIKKFHSNIYTVKDKEIYHVTVPSESTEGIDIVYDVVLEMSPVSNKKDFYEQEVKVFTNNPAFVFTGYGYVARENEFLIPWLEKKYPRKAVRTKPSARNPNFEMGFEKTIFFALSYILETVSFKAEIVPRESLKSNNSIISKVTDFEDKLNEYNRVKSKQTREKKKEKAKLLKKVSSKDKSTIAKSTNTKVKKANSKVKRANSRVKKVKKI